MSRSVALLLTVLTGFTGLVYEVTWQKYVATLLGSHSEATASVLGIFLAGLSVGYALFGRVTKQRVSRARAVDRPARLFLTYGIVEATIGLYALCFPWLIEVVRSISVANPHPAGGIGFAFDVALVALLLGPPTVLMGGTIPILTQALSRGLSDATRFHALVYGCNTAGAFAGALAASFLLIPALGLGGTLARMAVLNLGAGAGFALFELAEKTIPSTSPNHAASSRVKGLWLYALVACLLGFALMVLQNVLIRLGGLSLGSSEYTFSTVVAVFVLCIALGSFAVSLAPRIPNRLVLLDQCALVGYLSFLYLHIEKMPLWAFALRSRFGSTNDDFLWFHFSTFLGFVAVIGPAAILSGAVLPLLFHHLRRDAGDLGRVAGRLYSWNTVGSLFGALIGGYALLSVLDLHHVYRLAVAALAVSAVLLAVRLLPRGQAAAVSGLLVVSLLWLVWLAPWNPAYSSWGLFRQRAEASVTLADIETTADQMIRDGNRSVIYYDDDPIASIAVLQIQRGPEGFSRSVISNGKGDGDTYTDYTTTAMLALLPAIMVEHPQRVFVVGLGTGVTVGEFASLDSVKHIEVAEISPAVIDAAPLFDFANQGVSSSSKVQFIETDAYRSLMQTDELYDVISSEPPNPWVTGVEMLFTREFLTAARRRLSPGGVYMQWYHQYETDEKAVTVVLRTFASVFDRVAVWYGMGADLLLLGFNDDGFLPTAQSLGRRMGQPDIRAGLERSGVTSLPALLAHELLPVGVLEGSALTGPVHTLYYPILNHIAGAAFFRGDAGRLPQVQSGRVAAVGARNSLLRGHLSALSGADLEIARSQATREACRLRKDLCVALLVEWQHQMPDSPALLDIRGTLNQGFGLRYGGSIRLGQLDWLVRLTTFEQSGAPVPYQRASQASQLYRWFYQYPAPFDPEPLVAIWRRCKAPPGQDQLCAAGLAQAQELQWPVLPERH